jgi:hypothetical protein
MPYKSAKQRAFFKGCKRNPGKMKGKCPSPSAIAKFESHGTRKPKKKRKR